MGPGTPGEQWVGYLGEELTDCNETWHASPDCVEYREKWTKSLQFHWMLHFCHPNLRKMVENVMVNISDEVWEGKTSLLRIYCPENYTKQKWVLA